MTSKSLRLPRLPKAPGVYLMKDRDGTVIYVGKAKSLRERVRTYFSGGDGRYQIEHLMKRVVSVETIITDNEHQALILEGDLIKKFKPRYNIRLKDDRSYLSVRIDYHAEWPRLELVRQVRDDGASYLGPYSSSTELRRLMEVIKSVVPLRSCPDVIFYNRQRPCLEYEIKRCAGPCCLQVDRNQYLAWLKQAERILEGKTVSVIDELTVKMERASEQLNFEEAAVLRDRISLLESFRAGQQIYSHHGENRDVFALYREGQFASLAVLNVRAGRIVDAINFKFDEAATFDAEIIAAAVRQYYESGREIVEEVIVPDLRDETSVLEAWLSSKYESKVSVVIPERGLKRRLLGLAELNAKEYFIQHFGHAQRDQNVSREFASKLGLSKVPRKVECVDISNLQGSNIVASLVCFIEGRPEKKSYRHYILENQGKPDDFASIYEVVRRRLERGREQGDLADLMIIDGGRGQLASALKAREETAVNIDIISLAKERTIDGGYDDVARKPERVFIDGDPTPIVFGSSAEQDFLQRIRDEAHRFAISFHRRKRAQRVLRSGIDNIPGVGPERRRRLLSTFGDIKSIIAAKPTEVARVGRMPLALAEKMIEVLRGGDVSN